MRGPGQVRPNRRVPILRYFRHTEYSIGSIASHPSLQRRTSVDTRADANFEGSRAVSAVQFDSEIGWDGNSLTVWATVNGSRVFCENSSVYYSWSAALKRRDFVGDFTGSCSNF